MPVFWLLAVACLIELPLGQTMIFGEDVILWDTLFRVFEVQHQNLIAQLFQEVSGIVEQFGFRIGAEDGFSSKSQKADAFQNQTP